MDFDMHYTKEQEEFRTEVREWLKANIQPEMAPHVDPVLKTREQYDFARGFRLKLAEKGWYAPLYPKALGAGGLSVEQAVIIAEEMAEYEDFLPYDIGLRLCAPAVMVWGTEEQKQRILPSIFKGEVITWQCFTEPDAGTDLASLKMRADRDGDVYVLNGQKTFIGCDFDVDWLYTLAITDQGKPRHANMGAFIVPATTSGVTIQQFKCVGGHSKHTIYYDNVRVSRDQLVGGETDGWRVAQSTLEVEHGGFGNVVRSDPFVDGLFDHCRQTKRNGEPLSKSLEVRNALVDIWMGSQVARLFETRNHWMRTSSIKWTWEGSQNSLYNKLRNPRVARSILGILGPYALTTDSKRELENGEIEYQQRHSILTHPGGTPEAQKIVMARRIGIAKTKQAAAAIV